MSHGSICTEAGTAVSRFEVPQVSENHIKRKLARLRARGAVRFSTQRALGRRSSRPSRIISMSNAKAGNRRKNLGVAKSDCLARVSPVQLVETLGPQWPRWSSARLCLGRKAHRSDVRQCSIVGQYLSLAYRRTISAFDAYSPGVLLTAYELEECYGRADHLTYELLGWISRQQDGPGRRTRARLGRFMRTGACRCSRFTMSGIFASSRS